MCLLHCISQCCILEFASVYWTERMVSTKRLTLRTVPATLLLAFIETWKCTAHIWHAKPIDTNRWGNSEEYNKQQIIESNGNDRPGKYWRKQIGHYQNERVAGSDSQPQWRLWSFGGTGFNQPIHQSRKNAAAVHGSAVYLAAQTDAAFLLGVLACPVPPNDPKCLCVAYSDPVPIVLVMVNRIWKVYNKTTSGKTTKKPRFQRIDVQGGISFLVSANSFTNISPKTAPSRP